MVILFLITIEKYVPNVLMYVVTTFIVVVYYMPLNYLYI